MSHLGQGAPAARQFLDHEAALRARHGDLGLYVRPQVYARGAQTIVVAGWAFLDGDPAIVPTSTDLMVIVGDDGRGGTQDYAREPAKVLAILSPYLERHAEPVVHFSVRVPEAEKPRLLAEIAALPEHTPKQPVAPTAPMPNAGAPMPPRAPHKPLVGNGPLSGAHNPLIVLMALGGVAGAGLMTALQLLYGISLPEYYPENMVSGGDTVAMLAMVAAVGGAIGWVVMKKWPIGAVFLSLVAVVNIGMCGMRHLALANLQADQAEAEELRQAEVEARTRAVARISAACQGQPIAEAAAYAPGVGNHTIFAVRPGDGENPANQYNFGQSSPAWSVTDVGQTQLVACIDQRSVSVDSCTYEGGYYLSLSQEVATIRVVDARTGQLVEEPIQLRGEHPGGCPGFISSGEGSSRVGRLNRDRVAELLSTFAQGTR